MERRSSQRRVGGMVGALIAVLPIFVACSDDDGPSGPSSDTEIPLFIRADSSHVAFDPSARGYVWCGPWEEGVVDVAALHIFYGSIDGVHPGWTLRAAYEDFSAGDTLRFPSTFIWNEPDSAFAFLFDPPNELSSSEEEASGYVVFLRIPCNGDGPVELDMDAVLGSELAGLPSVSIRGTFRHAVTGPPPWWGGRDAAGHSAD